MVHGKSSCVWKRKASGSKRWLKGSRTRRRQPCSIGEGGGKAQIDVVGAVGAATRRDDAHVEQLREVGVGCAHDSGGLRRSDASPGGRELRVPEGGQELQVVGDEPLGGLRVQSITGVASIHRVA